MSSRDGEQILVRDSGVTPRPPGGVITTLCYEVNVIPGGYCSVWPMR